MTDAHVGSLTCSFVEDFSFQLRIRAMFFDTSLRAPRPTVSSVERGAEASVRVSKVTLGALTVVNKDVCDDAPDVSWTQDACWTEDASTTEDTANRDVRDPQRGVQISMFRSIRLGLRLQWPDPALWSPMPQRFRQGEDGHHACR